MGKKEELVSSLAYADKEIAEAQAQRVSILQQLAELTCPYKIGQKLKTNRGLGINGLVVDSITPPLYPRDGNWWQVNTFAISKAGEVTRRNVGITESDTAIYSVEVIK